MIPKFRAWRVGAKKMVNIKALFWGTDESDEEDLFANWWYATSYSFVSSGDEISDDFILMQSTGLLDKNGTEIFEGDIVNIDTDEFDKLVVEYQEGCYYLIDGQHFLQEYLYDYYKYIDIIGNIHENPELWE